MANSRPYFLIAPHDDDVQYTQEDIERIFDERIKKLNSHIKSLKESAENDAESEEHALEYKKASFAKQHAVKGRQLFKTNPEEFVELYNQFHLVMSKLSDSGGAFKVDEKAINNEENRQNINPETITPEDSQHLYLDKGLIEENVAEAALEQGDNSLLLKIGLLKPAGTNLYVSDGQVSFDPENMDKEQILAMIDFLKGQGLVVDVSNLKLENADKKTQQQFDDAVNEFRAKDSGQELQSLVSVPIDDHDAADKALSAVQNNESELSDSEEEADGQENNAADNNDDLVSDSDYDNLSGFFSAENDNAENEDSTRNNKDEKLQTAPKKNKKSSSKDEKTAEQLHSEVCNSIRDAFGKLGYENMRWYQGRALGGWTTFTMYDSDSMKPRRVEAEMDKKTKEVKLKYKRKYLVRVKNGRLQVAYSGNMSQDDIYELVSQLYANGVKYVRMVGLSEEDESKFREALGKRLMIPLGHNISAERYQKMTKKAGDKVGTNSPKYYKYRYDMVQEMRRQLQAKGIGDPLDGKNRSIPECREIRWAEYSYNLYPFRNMWEDYGAQNADGTGTGLRSVYENILAEANSDEKSNNGAAMAIGAKLALAKLYNIYEKYVSQDVQSLIKSPDLNDKERNALISYTSSRNIDLSTSVHEMDPLIYEGLYKAMYESQTDVAKKQIEDAYIKNLEAGASENPERTAVSKCWKNAQADLDRIRYGIHECDIPEPRFEPGGIPDHDFRAIKKKARDMGLVTERRKGHRDNSMDGHNMPRSRRGGGYGE